MSSLSAWHISLGDGDAWGAARTPVRDMACSPAPEPQTAVQGTWNKVKLPSKTAPDSGIAGYISVRKNFHQRKREDPRFVQE